MAIYLDWEGDVSVQIDAHKRTLGEVLQQGQHIIPRYQRRYAWETQNIRDFWIDVTGAADRHFLGSMVTSGATSAPREVIDGQQRLTTAIICLSTLRDLYIELGHTQRVAGINEYLEYLDRNGDRLHRLKNSDESAASRLSDNVVLAKELRPEAPGFDPGSLEAQAYQAFDSALRGELRQATDSLGYLDKVRDAVLEAEVVYINVEDRKSAFTIFETLNDRGKSLTVMDLVKNLLFAEIKAGDENSTERIWADIVEIVDEVTFEGMTLDFFLYYAWNSRNHARHAASDIIEQARLRRSIADQVATADDHDKAARSVVAGLHLDAKILGALNGCLNGNASAEVWRSLDAAWRRDKFEVPSELIYGILVGGSSQPLPLLLSLIRAYLRASKGISRKKLIEFLQFVENFQFRWSIAQRPSTSTIRRLYRQTASMVSAASDANSFDRALASFKSGAAKIDASDVQFRDGIGRLVYSRTRSKDSFKIRHILLRIEKASPSTHLDLSRQQSVEHLQGLEGRSEATPRNSWIFKIGNLALVPPEVNSTLPKQFADKCEELLKWINPQDEQLSSALMTKVWKSEQSNDRLTAIAAKALLIWPKIVA